jgi:hypothetical protein
MRVLTKEGAFLLVLLALFTISIGTAEAATASLQIPAGQEVTHSFELVPEDHVDIRFSVVGQPSFVRFSLTFPNSTTKEFGETSVFTYGFVNDVKGECVMHFVNDDLSENKLVTLDYSVEHYTFGIPQLFLYVAIIGGLCLVAIVAYALMSRPS